MEEIYEPLNNSLQLVGSLMDAAEAHGTLCGLLCTSQSFSENVWFRYVLGETTVEDGLASECQQQLLLVKKYTLEQLNSFTCEFMPLLPDDDLPLTKRVQALGSWCEGLLFGLGLTDIEMADLSSNMKEFINDVILVSRIAPVEDSEEENEKNYMQVLEYMKVGTLTLYEELAQMREQYEPD